MIAADRRRILVFASLAAFSVAFWTWRLAPVVPTSSDAFEYISLAENLRTRGSFVLGDPPVPTAYREPGYPAFLAVVFMFTGGVSLAGLIIAQWALIVMLMIVFWRLLSRVLPDDRRWADWLPLVPGLSPIFSQYAGLFLSELLQATLIMMALLLTVRALERTDARRVTVAGTMWAALAMTRLTWALLPVVLFAWFGRKHGRGFAMLAIIPVVAVGLWTVRNAFSTGIATPSGRSGHIMYVRAVKSSFSAAVRASYWRATFFGAAIEKRRDPAFDYNVADGLRAYETGEIAYRAAGLSEGRIDGLMRRAAIEIALRHPFRYFADGIPEIWKMFTPMAFSGPTTFTFLASAGSLKAWPHLAVLAALRLWTMVLIMLSVWGASIAAKSGWSGGVMAVSASYFLAVHFFFETVPRLAIPIHPFILLFACLACYDAYRRLYARR